MLRKQLTFFAIIFSNYAFSQDSIPVTRYYDNQPPETKLDSALFNLPNILYISFYEGFDDSICVFLNRKLFYSAYLKTDESIGFAGSFGFIFKDSSEVNDLEIHFIKENRIIKERLDLKYKSLQIRYY